MPAPAQLLVIAAWAMTALVLVGIGRLARRALIRPEDGDDDLAGAFWIGWATLVLVLQAWHIALPVDSTASVAMAALGIAGLLTGGLAPWTRLLRGVLRDAPVWIACVGLALWLSNHALGGARYGDSGAYFIPTVRWLREHALVPGLGNLHAHLAFNQSYFVYVAALEVGPFLGRSFHVANGLLILAALAHASLALWRVVGPGGRARPVDLFLVLMLPGLVPLGLSIFVTSTAPDIAVFVVGTIAAAELVVLATAPPERGEGHLRVLALLTFAAVTSKLTFAGFAAALLVVATGLWLWRARPTLASGARALAFLALLTGLTIGPWVARNVVMTGAPLFPSMVVVLPFEWRVQTDIERWFRNAVYAGGVSVIVRDPRWFVAQLVRWGWSAPEVLGPIVVGLGAVAIGLLRRLLSPRSPARAARLSIAIVLPALASLVFCAVNNPVPRYAGPTFFVLAASGLLFAFGDLIVSARSIARATIAGAAVAAAVLTARTEIDPFWLPLSDFESNRQARYEPRELETGLTVYVPIGTEACWDAPLPCTPFLNPALRLRRAGDLASGFMVDPTLHERYRYDPGAPVLGASRVGG